MQWEDQQQRHAVAQAARQMGKGVAEAGAAQHHRHQDDYAYPWRQWWGYSEGSDEDMRDDVMSDHNSGMRQREEYTERKRRDTKQEAQQQLNQNPGTIPTTHVAAKQ